MESNELTAAETRLHEMIKEITANIAEKAHCGEKHFVLEDVMSEINSGDFRSNIMQAVGEMLRERDDIQSAEVINLNVHFQSRFEVKQSQHRN